MAGGQTFGSHAADFLSRASDTLTDREETHGSMRRTYEALALQWSGYLQMLGHPVKLKASQAAEMMQRLKEARRHNGAYNADDDVDNLGYGAIVAHLRAVEEEERLGAAEGEIAAGERRPRRRDR